LKKNLEIPLQHTQCPLSSEHFREAFLRQKSPHVTLDHQDARFKGNLAQIFKPADVASL
jgi:hypothetical protein